MKPLKLRPQQESLLGKVGPDSNLIVAPTGFGKTVLAVGLLARSNNGGVVLLPTNILCDQFASQCASYLGENQVHRIRCRADTPGVSRGVRGVLCLTVHLYGVIQADERLKSWCNKNLGGVLILDQVHRLGGIAGTLARAVASDRERYTQVIGLTASPGGKARQKTLASRFGFVSVLRGEIQNPHAKEVVWVPVSYTPRMREDDKALRNEILRRHHPVLSIIGKGILSESLSIVQRKAEERIAAIRTVNPSLVHRYYHLYSALYHRYLHLLQTPSVAEAFATRKGLKPPTLHHKDSENPKFEDIVRRAATRGSTMIFFDSYGTLQAFNQYILAGQLVSPDAVAVIAGKARMSHKVREEVLRRVHAGQVRYLLSTSVAQEGIDVKDVSCVVFFEPVTSHIRYIQRAGRTGRHAPGQVLIFYYPDSPEVHAAAMIAKKTGTSPSIETRPEKDSTVF